MTRLFTSTLVLGALLSTCVVGAPVLAADATPKSVAVAPADTAKAKRKSMGTAPEIVITGVREKDSQVADNDTRPSKS